jgi:23S rRNA (uracil1939-C5)-methyltransferase
VLLDPPRAGLGKVVVQRLAELRPRQVAIVSCDPATLARDLAGLTAAGYRVEQMTLVDLFPQTFHLETVVRLGAATVEQTQERRTGLDPAGRGASRVESRVP